MDLQASHAFHRLAACSALRAPLALLLSFANTRQRFHRTRPIFATLRDGRSAKGFGARARPTYTRASRKTWRRPFAKNTQRTRPVGLVEPSTRCAHRETAASIAFWADIDSAPRSHMEKAFAQRRRQIVGDCRQLRLDVDHFNSAHPDEEQLKLVLDFTDDVAEMLVAEGIGDDAA